MIRVTHFLCAVVLTLGMTAAAHATCPNFAAASNYGLVTNPYSVATGDFNRDGKIDVVTTGYSVNQVTVRLGNGANGFTTTAYNMAAGTGPVATAVGDFNGDGILDLAVVNNGSASVSILSGIGTGVFGTAATISVASGPYAAAAADFDRDGDLDLAVASYSSNTLTILRNDGAFSFSTAATYSMTGAIAVAVADFNGDGKLDLAVAGFGTSSVYVLRGNGNATFAAPVSYGAGNSARAVAAGDFDRDGKLDLAVANMGSGNVSVLRGSGTMTFGTAVNYAVGSSPRDLVVRDLTGDGWPDIATANGDSSNLSVLVGSGNGAFAAAVNFATGTTPHGIAAAELGTDERPELITANASSNDISVLVNNGCVPSCGKLLGSMMGSTTLSRPRKIAAGDWNHDGLTDLAISLEGESMIELHRGMLGSFWDPTTLATGLNPAGLVIVDMNGDGNPDIVVASSDARVVATYFGSGTGTFSAPTTRAFADAPYAMVTGDFDRDGDADVAVTSGTETTGKVSILLNDGSGGYPTFVPTAVVGTSPRDIATGDFNGDGILDLATADLTGISVLIGNGDGKFAAAVPYAISGGGDGIIAADLNHDGRLDLAAVSYVGKALYIYIGDGAGAFASPAVTSTANSPSGITALDSGLGHVDLAVTIAPDDSVQVFDTDRSTGAVTGSTSYAVGSYPVALVSGDWNGDNRQDLAVVNASDNTWSKLQNFCPTTTTIVPSKNPAGSNDQLNFSVYVSTGGAGTLPGDGDMLFDVSGGISLDFTLESSPVGIDAGIMPIGTYEVTAHYAGDAFFGPSSATPVTQVVVIGRPAHLKTTIDSTNQITVSWDPVPGAAHYSVLRSYNAGPMLERADVTSASYIDTGLTPATAYLYKVRAIDGAGAASGLSPYALGTTVLFTDPVLISGETFVKAAHILELRTAVNAVRMSAGLMTQWFTDSEPLFIRAVHVNELWNALSAALSPLGLSHGDVTPFPVTGGVTAVNKRQIEYLRSQSQSNAGSFGY